MQRAIGALLGFLVTIALSRALGPEGLGVYAFAVTLVALLSVPISNGWGTIVLKATAAGKFHDDWAETKGLATRGAQMSIAVAAIVVAVACGLKFAFPGASLGTSVSIALILSIGCVLLFDQISALRASILRGLDYPVVAQAPEMLVRPLVMISGFLLISWARNGQVSVMHAFYALVVAAIFGAVIGQLLVYWKAPVRLFDATPNFETRSWLITSAPIALSAGLLNLNAYLGILALGFLADAAEVGIYRVAVQVSLVSGLAYTSLNMLASQRFAYFRASGDLAAAQLVATTMARIATTCSIPVLLVLILAGDRIVPFLFGEEFNSAFVPMIILALGQVLTAATGMAQPLLVMNGMERAVAKWTMLAVLVNIVFCLVLIPTYKGAGAAIATAIAAAFWKIALWIIARRKTDIDTSILGCSKPEAAK